MKIRPSAHSNRQRGAAALIVVMLLFFVVSLVAAYASRNLIFEQKTSANQYRSVQAFEAAEAGLEWALAMLNGGRIDAACDASANPADNPFRARYLVLNDDPTSADYGKYTRATWNNAGTTTPLQAACVRGNAGWACSCPSNGEPALAAPAGAGPFPAFRVRFENVAQTGTVRILSTGCTRLDDDCLASGQGAGGEAAATASVVAALSSALPTPPSAPLTVRGDFAPGAPVTLRNLDPATNGLTLDVGGTIGGTAPVLITVPGSPAEFSFISGDGSLAGMSADQMFASVFRVAKASYRDQPAAVRLSNCGAGCTAMVAQAVLDNPGRVIWFDGDLTLESDVVLGDANNPVMVVVTGNIDITAASVQIFGVLYSQAADWNNTGAVSVTGAAIAEASFGGNGTPTITYDTDILRRLRTETGSLVRVPGSWRDF